MISVVAGVFIAPWVIAKTLCLILPLNLNIFPTAYTVQIPELVIHEQDKPNLVMDNSTTIDQNTDEIEGQSIQIAQRPVKSEITTTTIVMLIWAFSALLLTLYYGMGYWVLNRKNKRWSSECKDEEIINTAIRIAGEYKLKKMPEIRMMDDSDKGPFTIGLFRKVIYLPKDVDGDGVVERVRVTDTVSGDYAFTQVGVIFSNGDWKYINFDEDFYSSNLTVGDLSGNGVADIVVMRYSIGSTFGAGDVSVLHVVDGNLEEYPYNFIKNSSLAIEQPDNFKDWWVACIGATIIEQDGKTLLRLLIAGDEMESAMCIDSSYQENGWYIENAEIFNDIYATGIYDELLQNKY